VRETGERTSESMKESDALKETMEHLVEAADDIRKEIVATKEGGAITGEERLREHVDQLYGSIVAYDGRPGDYHLARLEALTREFNDIKNRFEAFVKSDVSKANQKLKARNLPPIVVPDKLDLAENNLSSSDTAQVIGALLSTPGTYHFTPRVVEND
jgi:hypothetical protein